ncbi:MAG: hypothetical protein AB7O52_01425 [Planctomycetota bacterium]
MSVKERFEALDAQGDRAGVVALWREHPDQALLVIDSYLEGSLSLREQSPTPDATQIRELHERALRGASAADEALGRKIFSDYAAAFVSWNAAERERFRAGQKAYGDAREALQAADYERALAFGQRCTELARPLGDWWGSAMGWSAIGAALEPLGRLDEAVAAHGAARMIYSDLGLVGAEYRSLRAQGRVLVELGRLPHAILSLGEAIVLARRLEDAKGLGELESALANALALQAARNGGAPAEPTTKPSAGGR